MGFHLSNAFDFFEVFERGAFVKSGVQAVMPEAIDFDRAFFVRNSDDDVVILRAHPIKGFNLQPVQIDIDPPPSPFVQLVCVGLFFGMVASHVHIKTIFDGSQNESLEDDILSKLGIKNLEYLNGIDFSEQEQPSPDAGAVLGNFILKKASDGFKRKAHERCVWWVMPVSKQALPL